MIGRCIRRSVADLKSEDAGHFQQYVHMAEVGLVLGRDYLVFGVIVRDGYPWFLVCEDERDEYPKVHFGELFELVDRRVPPGWVLSIGHLNAGRLAILPEIWASELDFLERLVDGVATAVAVFEDMKKSLSEWHSASTDL